MLRMRWGGLLASHVILFLLLTGPSLQCGRGGWRRRGSRKMTPLVFKQHIPNVSENTLGGSGMAEGAIKRDSPKFEELKVNYNTDIIFKDEEGTMADRVMTQRCKDKLNTLAISVMNQWPGVKLRVTEGWDEDGSHSKDSLHYEGRAVDITTSDRERSKYGMLARLAVEAGFDWVYYESRGHIHCSVKSDTSIASNYGGCFSGMDTVMTESGDQVPLSSLRIGDRVLSFRPDGQLTYSPVLLFFHQSPDAGTHFLDLHTSDGILLSITANHLLYYSTVNDLHISEVTPRFASNLREGNFVYLIDKDGHIVTRQVTQIVKRQQTGLYAPLTEEGTIVVNGVLASCYAHIEHHGIAHTALSPVRWLHQLGRLLGPYLTWPSERASPTRPQGGASPTPPTARANHTSAETQPKDTVHWYAALLHSLADYVIPKHLLYPTT